MVSIAQLDRPSAALHSVAGPSHNDPSNKKQSNRIKSSSSSSNNSSSSSTRVVMPKALPPWHIVVVLGVTAADVCNISCKRFKGSLADDLLQNDVSAYQCSRMF